MEKFLFFIINNKINFAIINASSHFREKFHNLQQLIEALQELYSSNFGTAAFAEAGLTYQIYLWPYSYLQSVCDLEQVLNRLHIQQKGLLVLVFYAAKKLL